MTEYKSQESQNLYEILGVSPSATTEQIREVYRDLARVYHPDSNFYDEIVPEKVSDEQIYFFKIITAAYNTLTDPDKRAEYDQLLQPILNPKFRTWDDPSVDVWDPAQNTEPTPGKRGYAHNSRGAFGKNDQRGRPLRVRSVFEPAPSIPPSVAEIMRTRNSQWRGWMLVIFAALAVGTVLAAAIFLLLRNPLA